MEVTIDQTRQDSPIDDSPILQPHRVYFFFNCGKSGRASWRMGLLSTGPTPSSFLFFSTLFVRSIVPKMEHAKFQEYEFMNTGEPTLIALKSWRQRLQHSVGSISWRHMLSLPQILAQHIQPHWPYSSRVEKILGVHPSLGKRHRIIQIIFSLAHLLISQELSLVVTRDVRFVLTINLEKSLPR